MSRIYRIPITPLGDCCCWLRCLFHNSSSSSSSTSVVARALCTSSSSNNTNKAAAAAGEGDGGGGMTRFEAYRELQNLNFTTAAKILFTAPPKRKTFGFDFHLVQFFFACMPSLAVFLVAQYARYEIRRMEAEVELKKKKAEEEEKAKEAETATTEEGSVPELVEVKTRLDALEEAVKEIVDEKRKIPQVSSRKDQEGGKKEQAATAEENSRSEKKSNSGESVPDKSRDRTGESSPATNISQEDHKKQGGMAENGVAPSQELKK